MGSKIRPGIFVKAIADDIDPDVRAGMIGQVIYSAAGLTKVRFDGLNTNSWVFTSHLKTLTPLEALALLTGQEPADAQGR